MKNNYRKPEIEFVELKPEERLATCLKCPCVGGGTPGGNVSEYPYGYLAPICKTDSLKS